MSNEKDLNQDIGIIETRIKSRETDIIEELDVLGKKITKFTTWAWIFVWIGAGCVIFSIIFFVCKNTEAGFGLNLLGDFMAGTVASIWSLAGLFFIYVAFLGQKQQLLNQQLEIMYSQLELKYTRRELADQKAEMVAQNETLRLQKFENTFFQMLGLFSSIINTLDIRNKATSDVTRSGRDCFEIFYKRLSIHLSNIIYGNTINNGNVSNATVEQTIEAYDKLYTNDKSDLSHYYRTLYHIIKFIDKSEIENKKQYIAIARAQLSSYEQILIFYNCLHENGNEKFKPLIEKYALFKNIDGVLIFNKEHGSSYEKGAYNNAE